MATPTRIITRQRIRLIAISNVEYEQYKDEEAKRKEAEREVERARGRR